MRGKKAGKKYLISDTMRPLVQFTRGEWFIISRNKHQLKLNRIRTKNPQTQNVALGEGFIWKLAAQTGADVLFLSF